MTQKLDPLHDIQRALKNKQKGGRLENWYKTPGDEYVVWGNCYEDSCGRFADGTWIHTSLVIKHYEEENVIETLNSYYVLGKPKGVDLTKKEKISEEDLDKLISCMI